ncbi:hypothetical protein BGW36DRAFT_408840 [Talaromyces proteolyticus]|uniref:Cell wall protein n=1 Tax=Talaromyces proteolyticus TaxID=1131652 RepID=A0AAD4PYJ2_9EURO|nr:uncharacterized protein BGW36DRAFT_408840 [Talaromyces proteolyticus]KAH8695218.1 hypothetical protein BGW36DRAFT_408840 [Talaromyces proteolyticus]
MRSSLLFVPFLVATAVSTPKPNHLTQRETLIDDLGDLLDLGIFDLNSFLHGALGLQLFDSISPQAAAALAGAAEGGVSSSFNSSSKGELQTWITGSGSIFMDQSVRSAVQNWATSDSSSVLSSNIQAGLSMYVPACSAIASQAGIIISVGGILSQLSVTGQAVLDAASKAALEGFLAVEADLDTLGKDALQIAAAGGSALSASAEALDAVAEYLESDANKLGAALTAAIKSWAKNIISDGVVVFEALGNDLETAIAATSISGSVSDNVNGDGALSGSAQLALAGLLNVTAAGTFNGSLKASLDLAIAGGFAIHLSTDEVKELVDYLESEACVFTAHLKATLIYWLYVGVKDVQAIENVIVADAKAVSEFLESAAAEGLTAIARGAIALAAAGRDIIILSEKAAAELATILAAATNLTISIGIDDQLIDWLLGIKRQG